MILVGDIGAKQTQLALYEHDRDAKGRIHLGNPKTERSFSHDKYSNLRQVFADFSTQPEVVESNKEIYAVCLSIAGPIQGKCFSLPNAPWEDKEFCKETLTEFLYCPVPISFLNDMEAIGYSIFTLPQEEIATLDIAPLQTKPSESAEEEKNPKCALMSVVEGLGQALWSWDEKRGGYVPAPSEGGHVDFAARNEDEINLLKYFLEKSKSSPVSYEQVLSVGGLLKILDFVDENSKQRLPPAFKQELERQPDSKKIAMLADKAINNDAICQKTWNLFLSILGAQAGNVALTYRAEEGGVYLTGFVVVELINQIRQKQADTNTFFSPFLKAFSHKEGDFAKTNTKTPVKIVCKPGLAMAGAAQHALPLVTKGFFEINKKRRG